MNRFLWAFNLVGVIALTVLCVLQWRANRQVQLETIALHRAHLEQEARLSDQERTLGGQAEDLEQLRGQLSRTLNSLKVAESNRLTAESDLHQTLAERDQLRSGLSNWTAAVTIRDQRLQEAAAQLERLAGERDEAVREFNDLASRFNALVKDWNELQARLAKEPRPGPDPNR
ncbi:MAG: hypothetical protein ACYDC1_00165 [Limisphaerales bacterium]